MYRFSRVDERLNITLFECSYFWVLRLFHAEIVGFSVPIGFCIPSTFPKRRMMMKRFLFALTLVLGFAVGMLPCVLQAQQVETVVVDFEEFKIDLNADGVLHNSAYGWSWNGTTDGDHSGLFPGGFLTSTGNLINLPAYGLELDEYSCQSKGVEFYWGGWDGQPMNFWCGTGLSTVTDMTYNGFLNEMASITGSGNNESQTYAVAYGDCWNDLPYDNSDAIRISLPSGATVKSIAVTNTVYTAASLEEGLDDTDVSVPAPPITKEGEEFGINIYGIDANGNSTGSLRVPLGEWCNNATKILKHWKTVDLSPLTCEPESPTELQFSFYTTIEDDDSPYGFCTPAYFAFDDLVYEIEEE
jgi:hypothetical protein